MTKKELIEALKNVNDDAQILFGKDEFSHNIATQIYVIDDVITDVIITNEQTNKEKPIFSEKIFG